MKKAVWERVRNDLNMLNLRPNELKTTIPKKEVDRLEAK